MTAPLIRLADFAQARGVSVFALRATAREIADQVPDGPVRLDFAGIEAITYCFANELLRRLAPGRELTLTGYDEFLVEVLEVEIERLGLTHVVLGGET